MNDLISRQAAIDAIEHRLAEPAYQHTGEDWYVGMNCAESELYNLPSAQSEVLAHGEGVLNAQPERKKGKWIYGEKSGQDGWYCSECGGFIPWYYDFYGLDNIDFIEDFKTCPFCDSKMVSYTGADMRGEQDE